MRPLAPILALALVLPAATARADDAEKEKTSDTGASDAAAETGTQYPPPSTRYKVLAGGVLLTGAAWGISYATSRAWPENPTCLYNVILGTGTVPNKIPTV